MPPIIIRKMSTDNIKTQRISNLSAIRRLTQDSLDSNQLHAASKMSIDVITQIQQQIQSNLFQVNQVQKDFKLKHKNSNDSAKKLNFILNKKQQAQAQLQELEKYEYKSFQTNPTIIHLQKKYFKSQITPEQIEKIKKIKIMQKNFQIQLENKTKTYQDNLNKFKEEEKQLLQKQKKEKNQERLREVSKKIQEIRQRQEERSKKMEEDNRRIAQIKQEKKLYQKLEEQYKNVEQQQERKKQELKIAWKQQRISNFGEIKQHQKKYDDIMRIQRQQRQKKLGQLNRGNSKRYYQSKLLKDMLEEEEKAKREFLQHKNQIKQMHIKKEQYGQIVRNNHMPTVLRKEDQDPKTKNLVTRSTSVVGLYRLGNQYMKQAHQQISNLKGSSVSKQIQKKDQPFKYKNYLKQIKLQHKPTSYKQSRYLEEIDNLMKKGNMTQQQKFHKAKLITQKIEQKKGQDSQKLIDSINAKIYLLKQIDP